MQRSSRGARDAAFTAYPQPRLRYLRMSGIQRGFAILESVHDKFVRSDGWWFGA